MSSLMEVQASKNKMKIAESEESKVILPVATSPGHTDVKKDDSVASLEDSSLSNDSITEPEPEPDVSKSDNNRTGSDEEGEFFDAPSGGSGE